jgi:Zn-dependent metalloprotease
MLTFSLLMLFSTLAFAADSEERSWGPNLLRQNPSVTVYRENQKGEAEFVEGTLSQPATRGSELQTALSFFQQNRGAFRIDNATDELSLIKSDSDDLGMQHLRFSQRYKGIRVVGGELIAHFTASGVLKTVNGHFESSIDMDVTATVTATSATQIAGDDLLSFFGKANPGEAELVVFPWEGSTYIAWRMFFYSDTPMGRWEYFVDAKTGKVIYKANRIMNSAAIGTGIGVMGAARNHIDTDLNGSTYQMKDFTRQTLNNPHGHDGQMPAGNYVQTNYATTSLPGSIATDPDNVWNATNQAPAVDGQVYTALVYDWLVHALGRNGYTNGGASMLTVVNYSAEGDNNAYWDGSRIVIWSFSSGWRSLAGCPDVIAHEWGHAVTENCSDLIYQKEPGALNESFSDMMGAAFEWAHDTLDTPDWFMGENGRTTGIPFRSMSDPHTYSDPDYYGTSDPYWVDVVGCSPSSYNDYCGVHTNSGVGNKWFYLLSDGGTFHGINVTGIGVANAMKVAYRANQAYWTSSTDYHNGALGTLSAADDLDPSGAWRIQVSKAWNAVGVSTPGPSLSFSYPSGTPTLLTPNEPTSFLVVVTGTLSGVPVSNSGRLYYSIDSQDYETVVMAEGLLGHYTATLPGINCNSQIRFYFSSQEAVSGIVYNPDPTSPFSAMAAASALMVFSDNFETDKGWAVTNSGATTGLWNRGIPLGGGDRGDPATDYDGSGQCYLTDRNDGDTDVDGGTTILTSPTFDVAGGNAKISYARWYSNSTGGAPNADVFRVYLSSNNGSTWTVVDTAGPVNEASGGWIVHSLWVNSFVTSTAQMKLRFEASDLNTGSLVEAGVDAVEVSLYQCSSVVQITTTTLPNWTQGLPFSQQLQSIGGIGSITWSDLNGNLIGTGLTLSSSGLLSGAPTATGLISFTAKAVDQGTGSDQQDLSFSINPAVAITTLSLPDWTYGRPYSQQLVATGGTGTRVWSDKNGSLVGSGLSMSASGLVSGTPSSPRSISLVARVVDQVGDAEERAFNFVINASLTIATFTLPEGTQSKAYSQQLITSGGTGTKTWSDKNGNLPGSGLTLSASGLLSGTPSTIGTVSFTAAVIDIAGSSDERPFNLVVKEPLLCGDADHDGQVNVSDAVYLINYIFGAGPGPTPPEAGDPDCNGMVNVTDAVYLIAYIFGGGAVPCQSCQ